MSAALEVTSSGPEKVPEDYLILDVGHGILSAISTANEASLREFKSNPRMLYSGIEQDPAVTEEAAYAVAAIRLNDEKAMQRVCFMRGDGTRIEVLDNHVSQLILRNVLGATGISLATKQAMLREAFRVLKPGGVLSIVEDNTPEHTKEDGLIDFAKTVFKSSPVLNPNPNLLPPAEQLPFLNPSLHALFVRPGGFTAQFRKTATPVSG